MKVAKDTFINGYKKIKQILSQESAETKLMLSIYKKSLSKTATPEELIIANRQIKEIFKLAGFSGLIILPGTVFILPVLIKAAKKYNIDILPESFKKNDTPKDKK